MAVTKDTWNVRSELLDIFAVMRRLIADIRIFGTRLETLKVENFDVAEKRQDIIDLLAVDPDWKLADMQAEYAKFKAAKDWADTNFPD